MYLSQQEAIEVGSSALLMDEDTCATNLMVRDARMAALIAADHEPITPLTARIAGLRQSGVSVVLVMGGCGDYFDVADCVIGMQDYRAQDLTVQVRSPQHAT